MPPLIQEQLFEEIKLIPEDRLAEVYDFIHFFRLGLKQEADINLITMSLSDPNADIKFLLTTLADGLTEDDLQRSGDMSRELVQSDI